MDELESRIEEMVKEEFPFTYLGESMRIFSNTLPPSMKEALTKEERMKLFLKKYENLKKQNTENFVFIDRMPSVSRVHTMKGICDMDYFEFFIAVPEDYYHIGIPITPEKYNAYLLFGKIYWDFIKTKEFVRLMHISQLGTLNSEVVIAGMSHKRDTHSIETAILAEVVLRKNKFSQKDINLGIIAGLLHDIALPPFSDQGKLASKNLNEEILIEEVIANSPTLRGLFKKYGVDESEVIKAVRGENIVGKIINSRGLDMDTISYVCSDYEHSKGILDFICGQNHFPKNQRMDVYNDLFYAHGEFAFRNPGKLLKFLELRTLLFKNIYRHEYNRAKEAFIEREFSAIWGTKLDVKSMLKMSDFSFEAFIKSEVKNDIVDDLFNITSNDKFVEVMREKDLSKYDGLKSMYESEDTVVRINNGFNTKTSTKTISNGKIRPVSEVFPEACSAMEGISEELKFVGVYKYLGEPEERKRFIVS